MELFFVRGGDVERLEGMVWWDFSQKCDFYLVEDFKFVSNTSQNKIKY